VLSLLLDAWIRTSVNSYADYFERFISRLGYLITRSRLKVTSLPRRKQNHTDRAPKNDPRLYCSTTARIWGKHKNLTLIQPWLISNLMHNCFYLYIIRLLKFYHYQFLLISNAANYNTVILDNSLLQSDDTRGCIYTITT